MIITEKRNKNTVDIDISSTIDMVEMMNKENRNVLEPVEKEGLNIAKAIDIISENFLKGGSLLYFGAGTSGRLGVLDASESPPTFGVDSSMVKGFIAGGDIALRFAVEGAEDSSELGIKDLNDGNQTEFDVVVCISASGNANYPVSILKEAKKRGLKTISVCCNREAKMKEFSDVFIATEVGEEVITGSTRLKAGTAQKLVLNMLTTGAMVKIGKTYENLMVDLKPTNEKLKDRAIRIVSEISGGSYEESKKVMEENSFDVKTSILVIKLGVSKDEAQDLLKKNNGILRKII